MEYISKECYEQLVAELDELINVELPRVKSELVEAREKGDLSENFEYHAAKRSHGRLLGKIRFKQRVLMHAKVLDTACLSPDTVGLLRRVTFTNLNSNTTMTYTIVNPHEANMQEGKLSIKSPIAEAMLGKKAGDVVEAHVPVGVIRIRIEEITL
ncbi:MAG: transcription elongation factor GreA [Bacteroidaceae bacterium]|nr:transcription elongation factor GreA [Bacteroidaceae bacterium]